MTDGSAGTAREACVGCGALFPVVEGPTHRYLESAPGCWELYGTVLVKEYSRRPYWEVHPLTVDVYAIQHPGTASPQTIQSAAVHLIGLHATIDLGFPVGSHRIKRLAKSDLADEFIWLEPPEDRGRVTVIEVAKATDATDHHDRVWRWARSAWEAWEAHHDTIRDWTSRLNVGD